jgi:hypothetical protein
MKIRKLAIGIGGAVMLTVALAAPAPAQVAGGGSAGGGGGAITRLTRLTRPIIYDYESAAPAPAPNPVRRRHLTVHADGTATLVEEVGARRRVLFGHVAPAELDVLAAAAAQLMLPGGASTGTADGERRALKMRLGPMVIHRDPLDRPIGRMVIGRLDRIAETLAAK